METGKKEKQTQLLRLELSRSSKDMVATEKVSSVLVIEWLATTLQQNPQNGTESVSLRQRYVHTDIRSRSNNILGILKGKKKLLPGGA